MSARTAFELGWDYASFGLLPPDGANNDMKEGNAEGKRHFGSKTKNIDFMDRKWLQIRFNAIRRNRAFDDQVTPEFLAWILPSFCPISQVPMTIAAKVDTDWSVDRIINDGGYTRHNLLIVATRVNLAKGSKTLANVKAILEGRVIDQSLSMSEWSRLFSVMQDVYYHAGLLSDEEYLVLPVIDLSLHHIKEHYSKKLQCAFIAMAMGIDKRNLKVEKCFKSMRNYAVHLRQSCDDAESRRLLHKLCTKLLRKLPSVGFTTQVWENPATFEHFLNLLNYQKKRGLWPRLLHEANFGHWTDNGDVKSFREGMELETRGYNWS